MENNMLKRIKKEGAPIVMHEDEYYTFAYNDEEGILVPENEDLSLPISQFSLAHELGHFFQFHNASLFKKRANIYQREEVNRSFYMFSFIFSFCLLFFELDAWIKSYKILKEEKINTKGFLKYALECFMTYAEAEIKRMIKNVLVFYSAFTLLGFVVTKLSKDTDWSTFWLDSILIYFLMLACFEVAHILIILIEQFSEKKEKRKENI